MTTSTEDTPLLLACLRRVARRMGEGGGFVALVATVACSILLIGTHHGVPANLVGILLLAAAALCVVARRADSRGRAAMRRLFAPAAQTAEELRLRDRFGLRHDSDAATVRDDFRRRMLAWHSDTGVGGVDMHEVVVARDRLFHLVSGRGEPASPAEMLAAWRRSAGTLGVLWGGLLPSDELLAASIASGEPLLGR